MAVKSRKASPVAGRRRARLLTKPTEQKTDAYFRAGDTVEKTMSDWTPRVQSADLDINRYRNTVSARARDLVRNNGYAQSIIYSFLDNVVGHFFKLSPMPNYRMLDRSFEWSQDFGLNTKARWHGWANSNYYHCDYYGQSTFVELLKQALFSYVTVGEALVLVRYKKTRNGRYRLKTQLVESERLSTPTDKTNDKTIVQGVKLNAHGVIIGYYIMDQHPSDTGAKSWTFVKRYNKFGRKQVIHLFDKERPNQQRGRSIFAPIIQQFKLLDNYKVTESERAIAQAMFAAVISSDMPSADAFRALGADMDDDMDDDPYATFLGYQAEFKDSSGGLAINGSKVAHLATNESLDIIKSDSPNTAYAQFTDANVRELAAGAGPSYEQVSKDYSKTSYASARTAMIEAQKRFLSMRAACPAKLAGEIYALWLEEDLEMVSGYPDGTVAKFADMPEAWTGASWIAPGKGEIDPLKQANAADVNLRIMRTTREMEAAELGQDFDEIVQQRAYEEKLMSDVGLNATDENETTQEIDDNGEE